MTTNIRSGTTDGALQINNTDMLSFNTSAVTINGAFFENSQTISSDYTITTGKNALSAGVVTIANGITVTIPTGSTWTIV